MRPKVEAAAGFAARHGRPRHHRPAERRPAALRGETGTTITREP